MIDVNEAVKGALSHVEQLFIEEDISNLGLEEVEYDSNLEEWIVTVGFSRPWDYPKSALAMATGASRPTRSYKIVRLSASDGEVRSIKNYSMPQA